MEFYWEHSVRYSEVYETVFLHADLSLCYYWKPENFRILEPSPAPAAAWACTCRCGRRRLEAIATETNRNHIRPSTTRRKCNACYQVRLIADGMNLSGVEVVHWLIIHATVAVNFIHSFPHSWDCCRRRSAATSQLIVPATRCSTLGDQAFPVAAARAWNALPHSVSSASSLPTFRRLLKTHLFQRSF